MAMETLGEFLREVTTQYQARPALQYKPGKTTEVWTYDDLWAWSNRIGLALRAQGVQRGDRVILWAPNNPWWVASFFGSLLLGATVVPLDIRSGTDYVQRVVEQTHPKLAILARALKVDWPYPVPPVYVEDWAALPQNRDDVGEVGMQPTDLAEIIFTSGATGAPKGVMLTHRNLLASLRATNEYVPSGVEFRVVSILPLSHTFEQCVGFLLALMRGTSIYYLASVQPNTIFEALKEQRATAMVVVPQVLQLFMNALEREVQRQGRMGQFERARQIARFLPMWARRRLFGQVHARLGGHLQFFVTGGAPVAPELIEKWELMGIAIIQGYGATEAAPVIAATPLKDRNPRTVGPPVPGVQVKIADDGEILVKGANIFPGYWQNPGLTEEVFADGWYKTGDLGYFDKQGRLYLNGRKKDMIVLPSGHNVFPQDVERVLTEFPGVKDAAVVGLPTAEGQAVHAALLLDPDAQVDPDAVVRQANEKLLPHQRIRGYTVWPDPDLPRVFTMKVKKQDVLKTIQAMQVRAGGDTAGVTTR